MTGQRALTHTNPPAINQLQPTHGARQTFPVWKSSREREEQKKYIYHTHTWWTWCTRTLFTHHPQLLEIIRTQRCIRDGKHTDDGGSLCLLKTPPFFKNSKKEKKRRERQEEVKGITR